MEFSSFFFHLLFFGLIFQLSNTIVSSAKVQIPAQNAPTDKDSLTKQMDADIGKRLVQQRIKRDTDNVVYIDHRESDCLDNPRDQGSNCDASYAFATIAFYEWLHCQKNHGFKAFSEQYIIDCGHRGGNFGCCGGNAATAAMFSQDCGLMLQEDYYYIGTQGLCPFENSFLVENMGSLRIDEPRVTDILLDQQSLEEHLKYGPIIVTVEIRNRFLSYPGGVDDNEGHDPELLHTMLLIGHGRENGEEYWLFRNSYGTTFGGNEFGHYKLNKNVDCLRGEVGIGLSGPLSG